MSKLEDVREQLIKKAQANVLKAIKARKGYPLQYIIYEEEARDGITVKLKAIIFEEEFIPHYELIGDK